MKDVKARLHPTPALQKAVDEYTEEKIKDIQSRAYEAVMKERNDQLADLWAQVTLQGIGIDAKKTEEPL